MTEHGGTWDVVVCGGGMAGLCAGLSAAESGARTLVIEKGPQPGGSMRMSGGGVWTTPSMPVMERIVPDGDRVRQAQLVENLAPDIAWLLGHGVPPGTPISSDLQAGMEFDTAALTHRLVAALERHGGQIATNAALDHLERDGHGRVIGLTARDADGTGTAVRSTEVVLATGGFQGNHELLARWIGRFADRLLLRSNPRSVGDGLLAALSIGARTSRNLSTFYGHTMPALPADPEPSRWTAVTAYYTQDAVVVNERGERFFDESRSMADEVAPSEIVQQPNARAFVLLDERVYSDRAIPGRSRSHVRENFDNAVGAGAPTARADTLEGLADAMAAWGVDARTLIATLAAYNEAVSAGRGATLGIPRAGHQIGLVEPPFRALAVRPGITFTLGGIDVDPELRVLDRDGRPIPGLWAAGADAGGTYQGGYAGGLVLGLVQGRRAGRAAATAAAATEASTGTSGT